MSSHEVPDHSWSSVGQFASVRFSLLADADAGVLPRLLQPFAKRDLTPDSFESTRSGADLRVDIVMRAMPAEMVPLVDGNLRQVVGVRGVTRRQEITEWCAEPLRQAPLSRGRLRKRHVRGAR